MGPQGPPGPQGFTGAEVGVTISLRFRAASSYYDLIGNQASNQ